MTNGHDRLYISPSRLRSFAGITAYQSTEATRHGTCPIWQVPMPTSVNSMRLGDPLVKP
jgi:hypothetical protein